MRRKNYDFYRLLGLKANAPAEAIQQAYSAQIAKIPAEAQKSDNPIYQRFTQAYQILSDPKRRAAYDAFLASKKPSALSLETEISSNTLPLLDTAQIIYLLLNIKPPRQEKQVHNSLNLSLVLDRSTSMQGVRLERVKAAVNFILNKLAPDDVLSVVSFSDRAEVVLPAGNASESKAALGTKIRGMQASGGTEIFQGLEAGVSQLRQMPLADYTNHLVLLTDGHTYGDVDKCLALAEETAALGIGISAFGLGHEWNDKFLDQLVLPSGGQSNHIEKPEQIIEYLQKHIKGLGDVYARNVRLHIDLPQPITLQYGFKLAPFSQTIHADNKTMKLGNIEGRSPLKFLLELSIKALQQETQLNIPLTVTADIPSHKQRSQTFQKNIQLNLQADVPDIEPAAELLSAVRVLNIYRLNEKVWNEVEAGQLEMATQRMRHLSTRLLEVGETQLAHQAHTEVMRLEKMGDMSEEGRKKLKYGTRSLFTGLLEDMNLDK